MKNINHQVIKIDAIKTRVGILHKDQDIAVAMTVVAGMPDLKKCTQLILAV
jgi:hypothetical protein